LDSYSDVGGGGWSCSRLTSLPLFSVVWLLLLVLGGHCAKGDGSVGPFTSNDELPRRLRDVLALFMRLRNSRQGPTWGMMQPGFLVGLQRPSLHLPVLQCLMASFMWRAILEVYVIKISFKLCIHFLCLFNIF
jgi:hypothetical protein